MKLLATFSFAFLALQGPAVLAATGCPPDAVELTQNDPIQAAVDKALDGATFCLKAGIHRLQSVRPKNDQTFIGEAGAIMSGARQLKFFERAGKYWVATNIKIHRARSGACSKEAPNCNMPGRLFIDDKPLSPVADKNALEPGKSYLDFDNNRIYFSDNPEGRKIEMAETVFAFTGKAKGVKIKNLIVEKYDNLAQEGAINGRMGTNWAVENSELRWNSAVGIRVGSGGRLENSNIHSNGQLGVSAGGEGMLVKNNRIWGNNAYGFDDGWEGGGLKSANAKGLKVVANHVYGNLGAGLWCDINCDDVVFEDNVIERNSGPGIFYEISYNGVLRRNTLRRNGTSGFNAFWNANIQIAASENVEVYQNTITVNADGGGIILIDQGRTDDPSKKTKLYKTRNNAIHHNEITYLGVGTSGGASDRSPHHENYSIISDGGNRYDFNTYRVPPKASAAFLWGHRTFDWDAFRSQGQEPNGTISLY
jgi:parallel beta-helix repeat protein